MLLGQVINNGRVFERNKVTELDTHRPQKVLNKMEIEELQPPEQSQAPVGGLQMREGVSVGASAGSEQQ